MLAEKKSANKGFIINSLICLECACIFGVYLFTIFEQETLSSICIALNFLIVTAMLGTNFLGTGSRKMFLIWFLVIGCSLFSVVLTGYSMSFNYLKKWLMFASTINMFFWISNTQINSLMIRALKVTTILIEILFIFAYFVGTPGYLGRYLTFNFSNPNFAAISLLPICIYMLIYALGTRGKIRMLLYLALAAILAWFIWMTESRTCILSIAAFVVLLLFKKKYNRWFTFVIVIFPFVFAILYMQLIETDFVKWFAFLESEGKGLNSRERIWQYVFFIIDSAPFFGHYFVVTGGSGLANLHNIHLDTIASYGYIVFALTVWIMNFILNKIGEGITRMGNVGILAFYTVILSGTFEAALFSGSQGVYFLVGGFLMMAKYYKEKEQARLIKPTDIDNKIGA